MFGAFGMLGAAGVRGTDDTGAGSACGMRDAVIEGGGKDGLCESSGTKEKRHGFQSSSPELGRSFENEVSDFLENQLSV